MADGDGCDFSHQISANANGNAEILFVGKKSHRTIRWNCCLKVTSR